MTDEQHKELAALLNSVEAMVVVSGYDCELYQELYQGWEKIQWRSLINGAKRSAVETLWISPNCTAKQLPLFAL